MTQILRFFSPNLSQADTLSGGEFFAALRLVVHVENGKDVDRGLAFVQGTLKDCACIATKTEFC